MIGFIPKIMSLPPLKECPLCGKPVKAYLEDEFGCEIDDECFGGWCNYMESSGDDPETILDNITSGFDIECKDCGLLLYVPFTVTYRNTINKAIDRWNMREGGKP